MAPNFLSSIGNTNNALLFEIRLNETNIIFRGSEHESASALVKGTLVLCLTEPLKIQGISMRLSCESKIQFPLAAGPRAGYGIVKSDREHLHEDWEFLESDKGQSKTLRAGNYEYPFEAILPGTSPESVEGLPDTWIIYRIKATVQRGRFAKDLITRKHFRVIRTFDDSALELSHGMSIENFWEEKIDYCLSTPTKAVIFGTSVQCDFRLIPLLKGLKIEKMEVELIEQHDFTVEYYLNFDRHHEFSRTVAAAAWELPEGTETEDINGQEGYLFSGKLDMPKSLRECRQSVDLLGVKIKHKLKFNVKLRNPDGHISELRAQLPIHIFISPNLPVNDDHELITRNPQAVQALADINRQTPPNYGEHLFDQLYSDVDPNGYMTPGGSNTPLNSQSRSGSSENLASMGDALTDAEVSANTLRNRLSSLTDPIAIRARERTPISGTSTPQPRTRASPPGSYNPSIAISAPGEYPTTSIGGTYSSGTTSPRSRSNSDDGSAPQHIERAALSRVPSYNTALQTSVRTPCSDNLPTYQDATSRPSTPPPARSRSTAALQASRIHSDDSSTSESGASQRCLGGRAAA
ncbi:hypothetical protein MMC15_001635 [Xylographa vitiligo]|nr:hypothetical protein [Xylographa vitiligo]